MVATLFEVFGQAKEGTHPGLHGGSKSDMRGVQKGHEARLSVSPEEIYDWRGIFPIFPLTVLILILAIPSMVNLQQIYNFTEGGRIDVLPSYFQGITMFFQSA